jgi:DNA-binding NtrC family response regulator
MEEKQSTGNRTLRTEAQGGYGGFIGTSLAMGAVYRLIDSAAPSKATVFITGENGTGKEVCAETIHRRSPRREGPLYRAELRSDSP